MSIDGEWGYCRRCCRMEPVNDDLLAEHRMTATSSAPCPGSNEPPTEAPGPDAGCGCHLCKENPR